MLSQVDEEAERIKAERVAAYNAKKQAKAAKGDAVIAKSSILLDVKVGAGARSCLSDGSRMHAALGR